MVFACLCFLFRHNALSPLHGEQRKTRRKLKDYNTLRLLEKSKKQWHADTGVAKKSSRGTEKARDGPEVDTTEDRSHEMPKTELPASHLWHGQFYFMATPFGINGSQGHQRMGREVWQLIQDALKSKMETALIILTCILFSKFSHIIPNLLQGGDRQCSLPVWRNSRATHSVM